MTSAAGRTALRAFAILLATVLLFGAAAKKPEDQDNSGDDAVVTVVFDEDGLGYNVTSTKDISSINVDFCDEPNGKYEDLSGLDFTGGENFTVAGIWVKSGNNGDDNDTTAPPGAGVYVSNPGVDCDPGGPTCEDLGNCPVPTCDELDDCPVPTCDELENCPVPTCDELETCPAPTCQELDNCGEPTCDELDNCPAPTCEELDNCPAPTCEELDNCPAPTCEELNSCVDQTCQDLGSCEEAEVPFFTSPATLLLGALGAVGGALAIFARKSH